MQHGKLRTNRCPWFIDWFFQLSYTYISSIVTVELCNLYIASSNNTKWEYEWPSTERPVAWSVRLVKRNHRTSCRRKSSSTQGRTRELFSWVSFRAAEKVVSGKHSIFLTSRRTELRHLHEDQDNKGLLAENALAQPYLVQKTLVTW